MLYQVHDLRGLATAPAIAAVVAPIGGWLGRQHAHAQEMTWARSIGALNG